MTTYNVNCKYAPAKFRGRNLIPVSDNLVHYNALLTVPSEKAIFPILLKSIQKDTKLECVKIYDIQKDLII